MKTVFFGAEVSTVWAKVLLFVSLGKAFVAGAGLGLAALGVIDVASTLGVKPLFDFIQHEHVLDVFALGGGLLSAAIQIIVKSVFR